LRLSFLLAFAALAFAQDHGPQIGIIDFYGVHKTSQAKVRQALGAKEGDRLPPSKGDAEGRIDMIPGVIESHLEAVCCEDGRMILYVGLEEKGAPVFDVREPPDGDADLPQEIITTFKRFFAAERTGSSGEDLTNGHALSANGTARDIQEEFIPIAREYLADLRHTIHDSSDEEQRAIAVYVIGYAPNKADIVDDLQFALRDADPGVRTNATHGLKALAVYAHLHPAAHLKVEPTWFVEMLNSLSWTDRKQAVEMLLTLSDDPNASVLDQIRERALPSLIEMAEWKALTHALPPFLLLGRVAGMSDIDVHQAWTKGDRQSVIAAALAKKKK
jgi:hypothetical protein